jgi:acyl carrier protein
MTPSTSDVILRDLANVMAATFPDRDPPPGIGAEMRLFADLGLASIDVVVLGERLEQYYSRRLPFGSFLADLRKRGADDLALGDLVEFLQQHVEPVRGVR